MKDYKICRDELKRITSLNVNDGIVRTLANELDSDERIVLCSYTRISIWYFISVILGFLLFFWSLYFVYQLITPFFSAGDNNQFIEYGQKSFMREIFGVPYAYFAGYFGIEIGNPLSFQRASATVFPISILITIVLYFLLYYKLLPRFFFNTMIITDRRICLIYQGIKDLKQNALSEQGILKAKLYGKKLILKVFGAQYVFNMAESQANWPKTIIFDKIITLLQRIR